MLSTLNGPTVSVHPSPSVMVKLYEPEERLVVSNDEDADEFHE